MANSNHDDDRSIDGLCVFPACDQEQTNHLRLPVCEHHILKTYRLAQMMIRDALPKSGSKSPAEAKRAVQSATSGLVYFIRLGSLVKIGFTTNLRTRLKAVPHEEVLATMPGTIRDERAMHEKFKHLRQTGEWFRQEDDLTEFIESVRRAA